VYEFLGGAAACLRRERALLAIVSPPLPSNSAFRRLPTFGEPQHFAPERVFVRARMIIIMRGTCRCFLSANYDIKGCSRWEIRRGTRLISRARFCATQLIMRSMEKSRAPPPVKSLFCYFF